MIPAGGPSLQNRLTTWDGGLYLDVAAHGYRHGFSYDTTGKSLAFFPLYPMLIRAVHEVTRLSVPMSGIVAANLALVAALIVTLLLFCRLYGRRTAVIAITLLAGAQPMSLVFLMSYSESRSWPWPPGCCWPRTAGPGSPPGACPARRPDPTSRRGRRAGTRRGGAAAPAARAPVQLAPARRPATRLRWNPLYLLWVALRVGRADAWFQIQGAGWHTKWDNGRAIWHFLVLTLTKDSIWVTVSTAVLLVALVCATLVTWQRGSWPPLVVYGTGIVVLTLCQSNYYHSKLRLLLPALVFLVPLARSIARTRTRTAALTLTAATLFGCWYGAYMITAWPYAI